VDAIRALKERNGSSLVAVEKWIMAQFPGVMRRRCECRCSRCGSRVGCGALRVADFDVKRHLLRTALRRGVVTGLFVRHKNSFKLAAKA
jgi:hypothetical protein